MSEALVACHHLSLNYGSKEVLHGIHCHMEEGGFYVLTGPSGAGKSSLLSILSLRRPPTAGQLYLFGKDTTKLTAEERPYWRHRMGMVFQDFRLLDHLTVAENIALPLALRNASSKTMTERVKQMLEWIGMENAANMLPPTISGGQQQRVALARAVIHKPELLIADEPTGNLDPYHGQRCIQLLDGLRKQGVTILLATHDFSQLGNVEHQRLYLEHGRLVEQPKSRKVA